jgi:hypothetical protein
MARLSRFAILTAIAGAIQSLLGLVQAQGDAPGPSSYVVSAGFPTTVFSSYYDPVTPTQEPQPALYDPVLDITYPKELTDPNTIPMVDNDPVYYPKPTAVVSKDKAEQIIADAITQIKAIVAGPGANCTKCIEALKIGKNVSLTAPEMVPDAMVELCIATGFHSNTSCEETYTATTFGAPWTQILAFADVGGHDGQAICNSLSSTFCKAPPVVSVKPTFPKPKPIHPKKRKASGKRVKVLHLSDFHLDPRYYVSAEANCTTTSLCCRTDQSNPLFPKGQVSIPAPLYGSFKCDTPYYLGLAALQAIAPLTGTSNDKPFGWTIYTGDLVSHESQNELSRAYTEYAEFSVYDMFTKYITGPVFAVLGNHDSNPEALDGPHSLAGPLGQQFSWNYNHVAGLWKANGWIDDAAAASARLHYAAYSINVSHFPGLRMITFNTDFWYKSNFYNFIDVDNPDVSGTFAFMISELQAAEDSGDRVWILGHVLSGWDGSNPVPNPTDYFYQIVERYSDTIASIHFGHTHEDQFMIYYANNATSQTADTALVTGWIGPSVTPLTNLNSGFRMYEVDTGSFDIYDAYTWYADVSAFPTLDTSTSGPTFKFEYSTRDAYGTPIGWPEDAPLNATFWHKVTEEMETNLTMTKQFNTYQGKMSVKSPKCDTTQCAMAKVCYMRSGSTPLGRQCLQG